VNRLPSGEKLRLARYLNENGCPVQLESLPPGLVIEQVLEAGMNMAFDLKDGRSGYTLDAAITSRLERPTRINGVRIKTPWGGSGISLLEADPQYRVRGGYYLFPDKGPEFEGSVVLNRLLSGKCRLNPGDEAEGLIMAIDAESIPDGIPDNARIVVDLSIFDGRGNPFASQFKLCVDRSASRARQIQHYLESPRRQRRVPIAYEK
jgi:hypothetical protein